MATEDPAHRRERLEALAKLAVQQEQMARERPGYEQVTVACCGTCEFHYGGESAGAEGLWCRVGELTAGVDGHGWCERHEPGGESMLPGWATGSAQEIIDLEDAKLADETDDDVHIPGVDHPYVD